MAKYMIVDGLRAEFTDEKNILRGDPERRDPHPHLLLLYGSFHLRRLPHVRGGGRQGKYHRLLLHTAQAIKW